MGTRKIICMGSLFFLSVAIPYERQTSIRGWLFPDHLIKLKLKSEKMCWYIQHLYSTQP